jgi:hypothetical protein
MAPGPGDPIQALGDVDALDANGRRLSGDKLQGTSKNLATDDRRVVS